MSLGVPICQDTGVAVVFADVGRLVHVSGASLEDAVNEIESLVQNSLEREITTEFIGEQVMEKLKALDEVAYVRFASVYRQFKDIHSFMQELNKILEEK